MILGPLITDFKTLIRARPSRLDLPMIAYYLCPLIGLVTGIPGSSPDILSMMLGQGLIWIVPYVMGRIYFGRGDGPGEVAIALVVSGLSYIPVCLFEELAGPKNYLGVRIYGLSYGVGMVNRLGGWRPEGFLNDGIALACWMALTAVTATWLWLGGWRAGRWPSWAAAAALVLASLSCRGVYGYIVLAVGLASAFLTRWLRTRVFLAALLVLPAFYIGFRATGAWDGKVLARMAGYTGRADTVEYRLDTEDVAVRRIASHNLAFGLGRYIWNIQFPRAVDGRWLTVLCPVGVVGLALQMTAFHILPVVLALSRPKHRPDDRQAASPSWALACWCILQMIDGMHNVSYVTPTGLIAGSLVGFSSWRGSDVFARPTDGGRLDRRRPFPLPLIVTILALIAVEVLGRWRGHAPTPPTPPTPEVGNRDARP